MSFPGEHFLEFNLQGLHIALKNSIVFRKQQCNTFQGTNFFHFLNLSM